jgi:purine-binding chemotaxis protein CheW
MKPVVHRPHPEPLPPEVVAILERRAQRIRKKREEEDTLEDEAAFWVAEFAVAEETYAVPLHHVHTALSLRTVTPVPLAPSHVLGILRYQGRMIVALSLVSLLGVRGWRTDPEVLVVVEVGPGRLLALDSEQIPRSTALPLLVIEAARARAPGRPVVPLTTPDLRQVMLIDDLSAVIARSTERSHAD